MKQIDELDSLRGLAALAVVLYHDLQGAFFLGWSGVDLFFVLSGFLITRILLEHGGSAGFLTAFYARRALRIWPLYFAVLGACVLANELATTGWPFPRAALLQHLTFTQHVQSNWGSPPSPAPPTVGPLWSIAVEEQYYLLWPAVVLAVGRGRVVRAAATALAIVVLARAFGAWATAFLGRADGLLMGSALAALVVEATDAPERRRLSRGLLLLGALSLAPLAVYAWRWWGNPHPREHWLGLPALGALWTATVGLCVLHAGHRWLAPLRWRPLRAVGTRSYALYLFHVPVLVYGPPLVHRLGVRSVLVAELLTWCLLAAAVAASHAWFERPILALKRHFPYRRHRVRATAAVAERGAA